MGESPSFAVTQDECGRVAHTPIAVYYTRRVQLLKQAPKQGTVASEMKRSVVSIETFPLIDDEPKKKAGELTSSFLSQRLHLCRIDELQRTVSL